ncbi:MAG: Fe-S cluster assembly ATPase SufC [Patescibacteria group bacterium]|nr:Fe-S cluster assembly ATPase SufC [Patescibacteria group bacterium]MCL5095866.1 Fe-S cluster assembly ATPase SufC [Patescibacteria group bacterium]
MKDTFEIIGLKVTVAGKIILKGLNLKIKKGEMHILMGPNGAGKTSLVLAAMGHPGYKVTSGLMTIGNQEITNLPSEQRSKLGLFVSFQKPPEIPGVSVRNLLRMVVKDDLEEKIAKNMHDLQIKEEFLSRSLNENFSGGEMRKMELLQAKVLKPRFLILDEIDSGLDIDSLKLITKIISQMSQNAGLLVITHNPRLLKFLKPDYVHVMLGGRIVKSDGLKLGEEIERRGYSWLAKN